MHIKSNPLKKLREAIQKIASQSLKTENLLTQISMQVEESMEKLSSISINLDFEKYNAFLEVIAEESKKLPDQVDVVNSYLAQRGWFVPFHFADFGAFKRYKNRIEKGEHEAIEKETIQYIKEYYSLFKNQAETLLPARFQILQSAFEAHENKKYGLSIPVLLAQSEGIFEEIIGTSFYSNDEKHLKKIKHNLLKKLAEKNHPPSTNSIGYLLLKQFEEKSLLHENFDEIEKRKEENPDINPLNRNMILHGRDINYANEENSLRTISLIGLLCNCKDSIEF